MASLQSAPDELLTSIIGLLPSDDVAKSVQLVNHRLHRLSNDPRFWHARCRADYRYWKEADQKRLEQPFHTTPGKYWKMAWLRRRIQDARIARHFERVLLSKTYRVRHIQDVCAAEVEAKDYLLAQMGEDAFRGGGLDDGGGGGDGSDILARRYYASQILSSINRFLAIREWKRVHDDLLSTAHLDRAMAAFDMFVLHDAPYDMDATQRMLDRLAAEFVEAHTAPDVRQAQASGRNPQELLGVCDPLHHLTIRARALALVRWLRSRGLVGLEQPGLSYRNLRNCLLGHALTDPEHPSLPIVSAAIFVSVARRIGLNAHCCSIPGHVHCTVLAAPSETVDSVPPPPPPQEQEQEQGGLPDTENMATATETPGGISLPSISSSGGSLLGGTPSSVTADAGAGRCMFLDPYGSDNEVAASELFRLISQITWSPQEDRQSFLQPASTAAMVLRVGLNIESSMTQIRQLEQARMAYNGFAFADNGNLSSSHRASILFAGAETKRLRRGDPDVNLRALMYAAMWAGVLMQPLHSANADQRLQTLLSHFATHYGEDVWIVKRFLLPLFNQFVDDTYHRLEVGHRGPGGLDGAPEDPGADAAGPDWQQHQPHVAEEETDRPANRGRRPRTLRGVMNPHVTIDMVYNVDRRPAEVSRRYTQEINDTVEFRVGQVVRHKRYGYVGIINGWKMGPAPLPFAGVPTRMPPIPSEAAPATPAAPAAYRDYPDKGQKTAFYSCLRADSVDRQAMLAQTSLQLVTDPEAIPQPLFFLAGHSFKRFDRDTCTFVSNVRELFPDD